jgi:hypothetical protein
MALLRGAGAPFGRALLAHGDLKVAATTSTDGKLTHYLGASQRVATAATASTSIASVVEFSIADI